MVRANLRSVDTMRAGQRLKINATSWNPQKQEENVTQETYSVMRKEQQRKPWRELEVLLLENLNLT